nr:zinc finger BED domain-containing protein RICESLEEPER 2 [Tanacetum cinerariifolium]
MSRDGNAFVFNSDVLREQFARLVIQRGLSFNHFDDEQTTRVFQHTMQPRYNHLENNEFATFDLVGFWKAKESIFPVLSRMAMDIISVQATSVAYESAFSTSGRVLSIRKTRLTPASLEMCMCLKDHLDAQERKQHKSSLENALDFEEEILDAEVQQNEAISLSEEKITLYVASSEGTMSGSGSGGEEVDYDMTNYGDDY